MSFVIRAYTAIEMLLTSVHPGKVVLLGSWKFPTHMNFIESLFSFDSLLQYIQDTYCVAMNLYGGSGIYITKVWQGELIHCSLFNFSLTSFVLEFTTSICDVEK